MLEVEKAFLGGGGREVHWMNVAETVAVLYRHFYMPGLPESNPDLQTTFALLFLYRIDVGRCMF